jgi:hypothetical protein
MDLECEESYRHALCVIFSVPRATSEVDIQQMKLIRMSRSLKRDSGQIVLHTLAAAETTWIYVYLTARSCSSPGASRRCYVYKRVL